MVDISKIVFNISTEAISLLFMIILLIACIMQKRRSDASILFTNVTVMEVLILTIQIIQWVLWRNSAYNMNAGWYSAPMMILYIADFTLVYFQNIVFYCYISARITEVEDVSAKKLAVNHWVKIALIAIATAVCIAFVLTLFSGVLVSFNENGYGTTGYLYLTLLYSSTITVLACLILIIRHRNALGPSTSVIMAAFVLIRQLFLPFDVANDLSISYIMLAIEIFILYFGVDLRKSRELVEKEMQLTKQQMEIERQTTNIMVSQIQPHFLYNTLSVIDYLCGTDVDLARNAIIAFSEYLRMNMESISSTEPVPFERELEHTKTYLWIEQLRFSDILNIAYDIEETDFSIPPLSLQPLCENAVRHGVRGREEGGTVKISTRREGNTIRVIVEDDGIGFEPEQQPNDNRIHVGIANVRRRLSLMCNGQLDIQSTVGVGTIATITMEVAE